MLRDLEDYLDWCENRAYWRDCRRCGWRSVGFSLILLAVIGLAIWGQFVWH